MEPYAIRVTGNLGKIKKAFITVQKAHSGQIRKGSERELFYHHPRRVCKAYLQFHFKTMEGALAALCHDLVEDTWVNLDNIESWFGPDVRRLVADLTKPDGLSHLEYLKDFEAWPLESKKIKVCDIEDNILSSRSIPFEQREAMMIKWQRYLLALAPEKKPVSGPAKEFSIKWNRVLVLMEKEWKTLAHHPTEI
ncbi:hypothetical protein NITGR_780036 [Nitrospina gracilis 3/211]|uniref:HD/PDEase domain-containing protein n=1 Tax=Nitrospina gracilis (strain 3/211) TaxID=1266370 RepID=M1ZDZ6_NITG3|nr:MULTISPECIES: HD domain-containing protein [Nitrospina]MCF8724558.1 hypothetical protein [Nitrospina sp. Nb-3]CCQ91732.1 hypothetical protein NITGR_780036 [Nitrospina gracilis 3/211]